MKRTNPVGNLEKGLETRPSPHLCVAAVVLAVAVVGRGCMRANGL